MNFRFGRNGVIDKLIPVTVPSGRFSVKRDQYLQTLDLPDPSELYRIAKATMKVSYCTVSDLFLTDGKTVTLDEQISRVYYTMADIMVSEPHQIALANDLKTLIELNNRLNIQLGQRLFDSSSPVSNRYWQGIATFENTDARGSKGSLAFSPDFLREVLL